LFGLWFYKDVAPNGAENQRSVAVPGHSNGQMATRFGQSDGACATTLLRLGTGARRRAGENGRAGRGKPPLTKSVWEERTGRCGV